MAVIRWQTGPTDFSEPASDFDRLRQGMEWLLDSFGAPTPVYQ